MSAPRRVFVTVGSQMPFPRLIDAVDTWAGALPPGTGIEVFGQVGRSEHAPRHFAATATLPSAEYEERVATADLVVAHAGTGTIFTALRHGTPLIVLARRADLAETRNDHQEATGVRFEARGLVEFAKDERDLVARLGAWASGAAARGERPRSARASAVASGPLIERLRGFCDEVLGARGGRA